jgi:predicted  nucleic acid-binding Zn-ribbon protein
MSAPVAATSGLEIDALTALEDKILRAVTLIQELRTENARLLGERKAMLEELQSAQQAETMAKAAAAKAHDELNTLQAEASQMTERLDTMQTKRKQVVNRLEKLLEQMDLPIQG